jgi:hypothetical protein
MKRRRPLAPVERRQIEIPMPVQPRDGRESRSLYRAILALRANGHAVTRCGLRHHRVDGILMATPQLFALERRVVQREEGDV